MSKSELILGIETSCDETASAVVAAGGDVRSNVVCSQEALHVRYRGVVPEIACRAHVEALLPAIREALSKASVEMADIDAVAVTHTPGLVGALLIGVSAAKALAWALRVPLVGINHVEAHMYASRFSHGDRLFPLVSLVVSGGHTSLYLSRSETDHTLLGATTDDAAGEAFDKVATILGLGYPGGPAIDALARSGRPDAVDFPRAWLGKESFDFSFSGVKTAVLYHWEGQPGSKRAAARPGTKADVAASFQEAVVEVLVRKAVRAVRRTGARALNVVGGVACNSRLRALAARETSRHDIPLYMPHRRYCTDNAAMVAGLAYHKFVKGETADLTLDAVPRPIRSKYRK